MASARVCSECPNTLAGRPAKTKTCSDKCRGVRSRRIRAARTAAGKTGLEPHTKAIQEIVRGEHEDATRDLVREEIRPVVREAITEDTLRAIQGLVGLTPIVVQKLQEDLESEDATIRQKAYTLVAQYTFGHRAIVTSPDDDGTRQLVVNFEMPRPGDTEFDAETTAVELEDDEIRQCDLCGADKALSEFVSGSSRCRQCFDDQQQRARELMEKTRDK